jgi:hypothetical protein
LEFRLGLETILQAAQLEIEFAIGGSRKRINHPLFVPMRLNHPRSAKICQMLRHRHLRQLQSILEMTDTERPLLQQVENAQAREIAQAAVDLDQLHKDTDASIFSIGYMRVNEVLALKQ